MRLQMKNPLLLCSLASFSFLLLPLSQVYESDSTEGVHGTRWELNITKLTTTISITIVV